MRRNNIAVALEATAIIVIPLVAFIYLLSFPLNHDVAWLLEATRRWAGGAALYRDIIEINPPLIFFENMVLTGGTLTKVAYLIGICITIALSSAWAARWHGTRVGLAAAAALTVPAITDFGQRDHLALIFLAPFLVAPNGLSRREAMMLGVWAFLGVGLKPHFAFIPGLFIAAQLVFANASLWRVQNILLGGCSAALLAVTALIWPRYFTEILPLGRAVYSYYGSRIDELGMVQALAVAVVGLVALLRRKPFGAAVWGGLLVYFLQGKFWPYQLIPALGLATLYSLTDRWLWSIGAGILLLSAHTGPRRYEAPPIPAGPVLFLADRVSAAYPAVLECGATNASRYPTFWTLPGAWRSQNRPRFNEAVATMNADIRRYRPLAIYEDTQQGRIGKGFRFSDWADLSDYRRAGVWDRWIIWHREGWRPGPLCLLRARF